MNGKRIECALPLLLSLSAAIRANFTVVRLVADAGHRPDFAQAAHTYFALARRVIDTTPPMLVAVGGVSDADQAVARRQDDHNLGRLDWMRIDASGTPASTVARAKAGLVQPDVATDS